jgi:beta-ribofuranosylaminobenzene 5'-phosphate synthase
MPPDPSPSSAAPAAVEIRTPSRLHLGMLSFGVPGTRWFGGVGTMIDRPAVQVRLRRADRLAAKGVHAERALAYAKRCAEVWNLGAIGCAIEVVAAPAAHIGLGSGTQLGLAVAAGLRHLYRHPGAPASTGVAHPFQEDLDPTEHDWLFDVRDALEFARAVGRGRRSCVGVYGFSRGGLIVEAGRVVREPGAAEDDDTRDFSPMVARARLPSAWRCVLVVGRDATGLAGEAERAAFGRLPPVSSEVTAELSRIALLELLPAAIEGKFIEFSLAVRRYGAMAGVPFESESRALPHAAATAGLIELLGELGAPGATQSSWGPAVMACVESLEKAGALVDRLESLGLGRHHDIVIARFDSQGAVLRELE